MARKIGSRYTAHQVIGRGSAGTVWLGEGPEGPVAIKLLREDLASDQVLVGRFVQERTALTSLDHPRVVGVHDLVVDGDDLALVMELVHGADLRSLLDREGPLAPQAAVSIAADVAEGLAVAHAAGIVHRDVKPENILLDQASSPGPGGAPRAKLSDFGIARLVDAPRRTRATRIIGTPDYLAPEVIEGLEPRAAVDIYALATVLYELLAGFTPFGGGHTGAVLRRHVTEAVTPLPGLPDELWKVIAQCLAKAPASRLRAAELAARLREQLPSLAGLGRLDVAHPALPQAVLDYQPSEADRDEEAFEAESRSPRRRRGPAVPLVPGALPDSTRDTHTSLRRPSADELASFAAASRSSRAAGAGDRPRPGGSTAHRRPGRLRSGGGTAVHRRRRAVAGVLALLVVAAVALGAYKAFAGSPAHGSPAGDGASSTPSASASSGPAAPADASTGTGTRAGSAALAALPVWTSWVTAPTPPVALTDGIRAVRVGGTAYVFGVDADGYVRYLTRSGGGFGSWSEVPGIQVSGEPAPVAMPDGSLRLFATGVDGLIYQDTLRGGHWSGWGQLDGRTHVASPPAAAVTGTRIDLVARVGDNLAATSYSNGSWSTWVPVRAAGSITGEPALLSEGAAAGGLLDAYVVPADGGPVLRVRCADGVWQPAQPVTGVTTTTRPDAVRTADGTQYVFGASGTEAAGSPGGTAWTSGTLRGTPGAPAAYADTTGAGLFVSTPGGSLLYTHTA